MVVMTVQLNTLRRTDYRIQAVEVVELNMMEEQ